MSGFERTRHTEGNAEYRHQVLAEERERNHTMSAVVARQMGFTGDACHVCGSLRMQIAGHCTVCSDCGTTTGCS